jgi:hypothetical protein
MYEVPGLQSTRTQTTRKKIQGTERQKMSERVILLTTPAGFIWEIPAQVVATARANHYASDPDSSFQEEFDYAMSEEGSSDLVDWLHGNMDWDNVKAFAQMVHTPEIQEPILGQGVTAVAIKGQDA